MTQDKILAALRKMRYLAEFTTETDHRIRSDDHTAHRLALETIAISLLLLEDAITGRDAGLEMQGDSENRP